MNNMNKGIRFVLIFISIDLLVSIMILPLHSVWGGLYPDYVTADFFEVFEMITDDIDNWRYWVVQFTILFFVPAVFMLIMAIIGNIELYLIANSAGIILWIYEILKYLKQRGIDSFDTRDGNIAIGTWVTIITLLISFFVAHFSRRSNRR